MLKKQTYSILLVLLFCCSAAFAQKTATPASLARPKLVVGIVVDQMRWDYLYRFYDRYGAGGFKRMLNEGFTCENTYINYIPTVTAIGHTTLYTGSVPAIHGIAGNDFIIQATGKTMYCAGDSTVESVGSTTAAGRMSPRNLLASTITDELKLATNFRSKVIGVALKDRGAILPAGHAANAAYWFDDANGSWISSTYYMNSLPSWVSAFNAQKLPARYLKQDWNTLYPIHTYVQSSADDNRYEGKYGTATTTTFPVKTSQLFTETNYGLIRSTPYGNTLTADFARAVVENENMGGGAVTDFLTVSFSSTDYMGHKMGINSIEIEDTYLRLDRDLASFFAFLDKKLGKGSYTVFLSADHGAAHNAYFLMDNKIPSGFWEGRKVLAELNRVLAESFGVKNLAISYSNYQIHLNNPLIEKSKLDERAIRKEVVRFLRQQPAIAFAADLNNIKEAHLPSELEKRMINGYNQKRSGPICFVLDPGWYSGNPNPGTGTTHGTWSPYDAHIPLLWMGWGIRHGSSNRPIEMTDVAATLAALLHIQEPNGSIGKPVEEVLKK